MKAFSLFLVFVLSSCTQLQVTKPDGSVQKLTQLGGKGAYKNTPEETTLVFNNDKSFRDGALAITTVAAAAFSAYTSAAAETTAQVANSNAASVSKNAANNAAKTTINASNNTTKVAVKELEMAPVVAP